MIWNRSVRRKLWSIYALMLAPLAALLGLATWRMADAVRLAEKEIAGAAVVGDLREARFAAGRLSAALAMNEGTEEARRAVSAAAASLVGAAERQSSAAPSLVSASAALAAASVSPAEAIDMTGLRAKLREALRRVADASRLEADPDPRRHYMKDLAALRAPDLVDGVEAAAAAARRRALGGDESDRIALLLAVGGLSQGREALDAAVAGALRNDVDGKVAQAIDPAYTQARAALDRLRHLLGSETAIDPRAVGDVELAALGALRHLWERAERETLRLAQERAADLRLWLVVLLSMSAGGVAVVTVLTARLGRSVVQPLRHLVTVARTAQDDEDVRAQHSAPDELGELALALNDMLDRQHLQSERLAQSEERYALAARAAKDALFDWHVQRGRAYFAPRWMTMLGLPEDEVWDGINDWFDRVHPDDIDWLRASIEGVGSETHFEQEYRIRDGRGEWRWMVCRGLVLSDHNGKMIRCVGSSADIHERKLQESALKLSEQRHALALRAANDGMWDWDPRTGECFYSSRWKQMVGLPEDAQLKTLNDWFMRVHPDDVDWLQAAIEGAVEDENDSFELEYRIRVDQGWRWMLCRGLVICDADRHPLRAAGSQTDVTRRKEQEATLLAVKNFNESILKSLASGVVTVDAKFIITTVNQSAAKIFGRSADHLIGRGLADNFPSQPWLMERLLEVAATGKPYSGPDVDLTMPDGRNAAANITLSPLLDHLDATIGFILVIEDISQEKRVKTTMARYVPKSLVDQVASGAGGLDGAQIDATILFSDIRKFTAITESLTPRGLVGLLNEYLSVMGDVVMSCDGIIDKYIGDAIMAVFGAPIPGPRDSDNALNAANKMMRALRAFNQRRVERNDPPLAIGVGLCAGPVISGSIGSSRRMDFTVIGDSVNVAARLEEATKYYGAPVIFSDTVRHGLIDPGRRWRELDQLRVRGRQRPLRIFESMDHHTEETFPEADRVLGRYAEGLALYREQRFAEAATSFKGVLELRTDDRPAQIYIDRAQKFLEAPPPEDWDGVFSLAR